MCVECGGVVVVRGGVWWCGAVWCSMVEYVVWWSVM